MYIYIYIYVTRYSTIAVFYHLFTYSFLLIEPHSRENEQTA